MSEQCTSGIHVHPCSALVNGICKNGFPVKRGCTPAHSVSPTGQERWYASLPPCCDEEYPAESERGDL